MPKRTPRVRGGRHAQRRCQIRETREQGMSLKRRARLFYSDLASSVYILQWGRVSRTLGAMGLARGWGCQGARRSVLCS